jgi:hypothetical protein
MDATQNVTLATDSDPDMDEALRRIRAGRRVVTA